MKFNIIVCFLLFLVSAAQAAGDPFKIVWERRYNPVAAKLTEEYGRVQLLKASWDRTKSLFTLRVKCGGIVFETFGKNFDDAFDTFIGKAIAPEYMPYEEDD
jgi:hypothetical protein